ncbi:hypothetical protein B0I33_10988 [Prauserella shujinwangii]|uniref:Uncharacterized protein n=1 Tax=Prauserella shujinwangii TaxID=1453103 RepID=A0A2T0LQ05_9PSEU|nr:hypothetical protein [Prauserella shujinwangii]PRX45425.1 hypothetical protein B0I33_10988 [Prauserella shujinwangii]
MGLQSIWIRTLSDGLVRADQVIGVDSHRTPALTGKPSRWLLDVTLAVPAGSGNTDGWDVAELHRTLTQTDWHPAQAPEDLARLLSGLRHRDIAGIITAVPDRDRIRFEFQRFETTADGADAVEGTAEPPG